MALDAIRPAHVDYIADLTVRLLRRARQAKMTLYALSCTTSLAGVVT
jgi:hypothetical protein